MDLNEVLTGIDLLEKSPIRKYLKKNKELSLFEEERIILSGIDNIIETNKENLRSKVKVAVLGEVKAGKSTIVNALLGKMISYTNVVEATAAIIEIKYSLDEKIIIQKKNKEELKLNSLIGLENLINENRYNQEFFNKIDKISIFTDTERLKEITVVDTPGLNTITIENAERTNNYIANSDVILWILNSNHLGQSDITEKIEEVLDFGKPIIGVLNRIDEVNGDRHELIDYVNNEMGYMFTDVFAISAKLAWDGYEENNNLKIGESNINELYHYLLNNIEKNAESVQQESILGSMNVQVMKDLHLHKSTKVKLDSMLNKMNEDLNELNEFNNRIKKIIDNKISEWIDVKFFEEEKIILNNCSNDQELMNLVEKYTNNEYINGLLKYEYEELNNYLLDEWRNNNEQFVRRQVQTDIAVDTDIHSYSIVGIEVDRNKNDIMEGVKQGGATAGAIGLGLAGYAAWLGPAAAYVSIGSAVSAFFPPLLIAGAIGGGVWKLVGKDKKKLDRYSQIDMMVFQLKNTMKSNVENNMKSNLYEASEHYYNNSVLMIISILQQCNTSKDEAEKIILDLETYIRTMESNFAFSNSIFSY